MWKKKFLFAKTYIVKGKNRETDFVGISDFCSLESVSSQLKNWILHDGC